MRSLLLAGGRSSRMGRDKALIEVDGEPCIARVAMALAEAGREPIRIAVAEPEDIERYGSVLRPHHPGRVGSRRRTARRADRGPARGV